MRLTTGQVNLIKLNTACIFGDAARVYLFGSRINDNAKGGDIDVFIELDNPVDKAVGKLLELNSELQLSFGLQKIDILFHAPNYKRQPIHDIAKNEGLLL